MSLFAASIRAHRAVSGSSVIVTLRRSPLMSRSSCSTKHVSRRGGGINAVRRYTGEAEWSGRAYRGDPPRSAAASRNSRAERIGMPSKLRRSRRCRSPETMQFAPAVTAHASTWLSSGSSSMAKTRRVGWTSRASAQTSSTNATLSVRSNSNFGYHPLQLAEERGARDGRCPRGRVRRLATRARPSRAPRRGRSCPGLGALPRPPDRVFHLIPGDPPF